MLLSDFTYKLPVEFVAKNPPIKRGTSRLLVLNKNNGQVVDDFYKNIGSYLKSGDVLVLNKTKVIRARLFAKTTAGRSREIIVLEKHGKLDDWHRHRVMYRGKLKVNDTLSVGDAFIKVKEILGDGLAMVSSDQDLLKIAAKYGNVPLPPYLHRAATKQDETRYQTVWAANEGSVAAPTASLNMTEQNLNELKNKGVKIVYITLHVGFGTFMPIRCKNLADHKMHKEYFEIPKITAKVIKDTKQAGGRIIALGTTVVRTLEYAADSLLNQLSEITGEADIFIYPGYHFKMVDVLITNFHAPGSTVLMMAAAFSGWDNLKNAYNHALQDNYKFLSYGDSMLIM